MKSTLTTSLLGGLVLVVLAFTAWIGHGEKEKVIRADRPKATMLFKPQEMADALHAVIAADREVYAKVIVQRLSHEDNVIKCTEQWEPQKALPVPSQMLRLGAEAVQSKGAEFSYAVRSLVPIHKRNAPETDAEKQGLEFVRRQPGENFYTEEVLGGRHYFTAVYADTAAYPTCVACHNGHKDSPKKDYKLGDVMGGIVIRVALEF